MGPAAIAVCRGGRNLMPTANFPRRASGSQLLIDRASLLRPAQAGLARSKSPPVRRKIARRVVRPQPDRATVAFLIVLSSGLGGLPRPLGCTFVAGIAWIGSRFLFRMVIITGHSGRFPALNPTVAASWGPSMACAFYRSAEIPGCAGRSCRQRCNWFYWEAYTTCCPEFGVAVPVYILLRPTHLSGIVGSSRSPPRPSRQLSLFCSVSVGVELLVLRRAVPALRSVATPGVGVARCVWSQPSKAWGVCQLVGGRGAFHGVRFRIGSRSMVRERVCFVIISGPRELVRAQALRPRSRIPGAGSSRQATIRPQHVIFFHACPCWS